MASPSGVHQQGSLTILHHINRIDMATRSCSLPHLQGTRMACRDLDFLWKEYFRDPSQFWGNRNHKRGPMPPDFRRKQTRQPLWMDDQHNLPWVQEEFRVKAKEFYILSDLMQSIKACGKQKDLCKGSRIHTDILKTGLLNRDIYIGTALIWMYARCSALAKAQEVFDGLPKRNAVSWNALIAGYAQNGLGEEALRCFDRMRDAGFSPTAVTFICILKACGGIGATQKGEEIHAEVRRLGLLENHDVVLGNALVDMYAKCGALAKAQEVFNVLPLRDAVSWNVLIAGYVQHGLGDEALNCLRRMQEDGLSPDAVTFSSILKACGSIRAIKKGKEIHAEVCRLGLLQNHDIVLGNALVNMYAKCGVLAKAQEVFDGLLVRDAVSWTVLIAGYSQHGLGEEALNCFGRMQYEGFSPNAVTFVCALKACGSMGAANKGKQIHSEILWLGLLENHEIVLGNALVNMYAKCGMLAKAQQVFDRLPIQDAVSWNVLIAGYAQHGLSEEALNCFEQMQEEGFSPDAVAFVCALKACATIGATKKGEEIHAEVHRLGLLENHDIVLGNALVNMYAKCGALAKAQQVFDGLRIRDAVSWTGLIAGYSQHGLGQEALNCFVQMRDEGFSPDAATYVCILKVCSSIGAIEKGEEIHAEICRLGLLENLNTILGTALVDMYAKCGALTKAQQVFDGVCVQDAVSWTALIAGYAQHWLAEEAINCFEWMRAEGFSPDTATFVCILKACGSIGATKKGEEIHAEVRRLGLLESHASVVGTALVDMYAKCGALAKAQQVFDGLPLQDASVWNALMAGYARLGKAERVFDLFRKMREKGIEPNGVTLSVLLTTCSHAGLVEEGQMYFDTISTIYWILPSLEHHICLVDLFSRAGHFDKAIRMLEDVPDSDLWLALSDACKNWVNMELGRWVFRHAVLLDDKCTTAYVCMGNICEAAGLQEEADKIEALRTKNGAWKVPGCCWWTDVGGNVLSVTVGDKSHPQSDCIYAKLKDIGQILRLEGYSPHLP